MPNPCHLKDHYSANRCVWDILPEMVLTESVADHRNITWKENPEISLHDEYFILHFDIPVKFSRQQIRAGIMGPDSRSFHIKHLQTLQTQQIKLNDPEDFYCMHGMIGSEL